MAKRLGWYGNLPVEALQSFPGLGLDPLSEMPTERREFAQEVVNFQQSVVWFDEDDADGKLGKQTWRALDKIFVEADPGDYYIHNGVRIKAVTPFDILTWREDGGLSLHEDGGFRTVKNRQIRIITIHWGGLNVKHCRNALAAEDLSSHFGTGAATAYQWLDTNYSAYHAGYVNDFSIGIDICQHPVVKFLERYTKDPASDVRVVDNTTGRGHKRVLSLDSRTADVTRDLVLDLCRAYDIPLEVPRDRSGKVDHSVLNKYGMQKGAFEGVVGHHHLTKTKWDMAVWWSQIFDGTPLGD